MGSEMCIRDSVTTSVTTATLVGRAHRYSRIETSKLTVIRKRFSIVNENARVQISSRASEGCAERPPGCCGSHVCGRGVSRRYRVIVVFLARDVFVGTDRHAIAMMFVRLSVRLSGMGVHCDHTVHASADLSLWLNSSMFWSPWHQSMSTYTSKRLFPLPPEREV